MKSLRYILLIFTFIVLLTPTFALRPHYNVRQDENTNDEHSQTEIISSSAPESTRDPSPPSSAHDQPATATIQPPATSTNADSNAPTAIGQNPDPTATSEIYDNASGELPITPRLSPAVGVGGAILLLTGGAYGFIGVRHEMVQIFFSTAYLASLSVTVLIEYVVKEDVSDGVQGGYLVAITSAGLIFGCLTFIFKDMVEGLCCLLGGFCLGMWFLTLKSGGLVQSTGGRVGLICAFTAVAFSLSFSHYTRLYASIGCIAFSGATIIVLGIDCFSRAGYKEFWIYLWNLNNRAIFPLETQTYPVTRGMTVEIAAIIILTLFAVISQLKLWKIVRERKDKKTAAQVERQKHLDALDSEANLRYQNQVAREQEEWEATHGDKEHGKAVAESKSSISDVPKLSMSCASQETSRRSSQATPQESVEMLNIDKMNDTRSPYYVAPDTGTVTVAIAEEDEIHDIDPQDKSFTTRRDSELPGYCSSLNDGTDRRQQVKSPDSFVSEVAKLTGSRRTSLRASSSLRVSVPAPAVMPLPIPIFTSNRHTNSNRGDDDDDTASKRGSKRFSATSSLKRLSQISNRRSQDVSSSQEDLIIPHIEEDRRSSIAATLDGLDMDDFSLPPTAPPSRPNSWLNIRDELPKIDVYEPDGNLSPTSEGRPRSFMDVASEVGTIESSKNASCISIGQHGLRGSLTPSTNPKHVMHGATRERRQLERAIPEDSKSNLDDSALGSPSTERVSRVTSITDQLPDKLSKTALIYRTNEWIKHAADADQDGLGSDNLELQEPESPGTRVETGFSFEAAAPVNIEDLQKTMAETIPAQPEPAAPVSRRQSRDIPTPSMNGRASALERLERPASRIAQSPPSFPAEETTQSSTTIPQPNLIRHASAPKLGGRGMGFRTSSTPIIDQIVQESPLEDPEARSRDVATPLPTNTLINRRESMMRSRITSTNFNSTSLPNLLTASAIQPSDSASIRNMATPSPLGTDEDDIPLAERKQMLQQRRFSGPQRNTLNPTQSTMQLIPPPVTQVHAIYDSHQPKRTSGVDAAEQANRMARWRMSQRELLAPSRQSGFVDENRRQQMLEHQRQSQMAKQQEEVAAVSRDMFFDDIMRRGDMQDLHREAMRKMQAKAKGAH
ncbi:hypothetical protein EJ05DRAFT_478107 [Pseudovirgaria hyperparasitica]|uniref:TM7S3/TM198-like domain-containing protein n=1 Tax=Pseudovirgaria hyperparasitica TaxID=470096 RepID=A0A6A6W221_9PEZI|nr:uncharacterized protein EJ05DRAFT_478107 [Pseudovirgaria hyperparasitica]KAF2756064.1 hypothetical protein EJ05DRAFT_478107 [Pseudovirgaria hyperparasitica]